MLECLILYIKIEGT